MSVPLGGDWGSGERVFGPPRGTVEPDWFVPLVRERHPGATHEAARTAVAAVWQVVHAEAERTGVAPAEVDRASVRRLLGMAGTPAEAAAARDAAPSGDDRTALLGSALTVVLAATRAYDDSQPVPRGRARGVSGA